MNHVAKESIILHWKGVRELWRYLNPCQPRTSGVRCECSAKTPVPCPGKVVPAGPVRVTVVKVDRSCARSPTASGSSASLNNSCAKLIRCSRSAEPTDEPDQASTAHPKPAAPSQQPKLAIARLASLASIHATTHSAAAAAAAAASASASPQVITTTVADISDSAIFDLGDPSGPSNFEHLSCHASAEGSDPTPAGPSKQGHSECSGPTASGGSNAQLANTTASEEPSTSTAVAAPRRICTLKVKIFLIKHLSKLVACNKKMFLPVKSNT
ncbi:hypothetical protein ZHAS_00017246 [Anopheles sinensis]|uniref:Uncharacterized protein n=1 Tax=Anopheles sinensis TaxID=74873 RepID=A0A084WFV1_ANOSI|nr:hypothetical protein ZHAS_00017246 [Anopheles sinensis]